MPANEVTSKITTFSHRTVRTNDFNPTASNTPALVVWPGGVHLILGGLATAAIARGVSKILQVPVDDQSVR